jgi:two-component system, NarL family, nitrate/nitrite response regulator NarL
MERQVTVVVVEDHHVVIEGIRSWARADPGQRVTITHVARDLDELAAWPGPAPNVLILDLELGGRLVIPDIPRLAADGHRIVVFSGHSSSANVMAALDAGAHAFVTKHEGPDDLVEAVVAAAADRPYVTKSQAQAILDDTSPARKSLSDQEVTALRLWFTGMSKAAVGRRMGITDNTVRQYIARARVKYANAGRPAPTKELLLARAIEDGIITPAEATLYTSRAGRPQDFPEANRD